MMLPCCSPADTPSYRLLVKPCLPYTLFPFSLFSLKRLLSESMTKELIPHKVTIFPCIKEVTLQYWNQRCAMRGFLFYLAEIKASRGLPTNNHLAPSPHVIWNLPDEGKAEFLQHSTARALLLTTLRTSSKYANICKHLKNLPQSDCKQSWLVWAAIGGAFFCTPVALSRFEIRHSGSLNLLFHLLVLCKQFSPKLV